MALEKKLSAEGIPEPVPRKLIDGINRTSDQITIRGEQNPDLPHGVKNPFLL
jgi:hypothetical protein